MVRNKGLSERVGSTLKIYSWSARLFSMPEAWRGNNWPEDAALVVGEGVPVNLELDPDPELLVRGTYGSAPKCYGSPTHCLIPCRRRWRGNDWPEDAAFVVGEGVPVHLDLDPDPDLLVRGTYGSAPKCHGSPNTLHYSMPEAWRGNDWPEDATLVVGEGVPVHLELDPDPDLLVRGTDPHQNVTDPQHTALFHAGSGGEGMTDLRTLLSL